MPETVGCRDHSNSPIYMKKPERVTVREMYATIKQVVPKGSRGFAMGLIEDYARLAMEKPVTLYRRMYREPDLLAALENRCNWDNFQILKALPQIRKYVKYKTYVEYWRRKHGVKNRLRAIKKARIFFERGAHVDLYRLATDFGFPDVMALYNQNLDATDSIEQNFKDSMYRALNKEEHNLWTLEKRYRKP